MDGWKEISGLIRRFKSGDTGVSDRLFRLLHEEVGRTCRRIIYDDDVAEELVSTILCEFIEEPERLPERGFAGFLSRRIWSRFVDLHRQRRRLVRWPNEGDRQLFFRDGPSEQGGKVACCDEALVERMKGLRLDIYRDYFRQVVFRSIS